MNTMTMTTTEDDQTSKKNNFKIIKNSKLGHFKYSWNVESTFGLYWEYFGS